MNSEKLRHDGWSAIAIHLNWSPFIALARHLRPKFDWQGIE